MLTEHGLQIAPSTYYEHVSQAADRRASIATRMLLSEIRRVHAGNYGVYGARKVWLQLNREGIPVARCTVERLMRAGRPGRRGPRARSSAPRSPTRPPSGPGTWSRRDFAPAAPDRLWVADITYVSTWSRVGVRRVRRSTRSPAGSSAGGAARAMTTQLVLDALEQAVWTRQRDGRVAGFRCGTYRPRVAVHVDPVHRTPRRGRHRRLGRHRRRRPTTTPWPRRSTGCTRPS